MKQRYVLPERSRRLSGSALKLIAVITMLIDHSSICFAPLLGSPALHLFRYRVTPYLALRFVGRLAFPIFCFLLAEGFRHTRSKPRYALNLLIFALLSELPYNLFNSGALRHPTQNVFFTLLLGYLAIWALDAFRQTTWKQLLSVGALFALAWLLKADYGWAGFLFILLMALLGEFPVVQALACSSTIPWHVGVGLAFLPINCYSGKRGFIRSGWLKYAFYAFYPLHLLLLWQIHLRLFGY